MTWLTPLIGGIVLASVIPPLLALYFLRLRRSRRPIPSTMLWKRETEDIRANAPFQRLRASILLFIQLIVLILLGIALMQPQIDAGSRKGGKTVILIDNSASMNSTDGEGGRTRLEDAKELAIERVEELHAGGLFGGVPGEVMVIAFNQVPEVRTPFTDSRNQALSAIKGITPTDDTSTIGPALELARAYATVIDPESTDRSMVEPAVLELYSDGRISDLDENVLQESESIKYHVIGSADSKNVSIISLAADRPYDAPGKVQVFAAFQNTSVEPVEASVQLSVNGTVRMITPRPVQIPAAKLDDTGEWIPGRKQITFSPFDQPRDAVIEVELLHKDALPVDNVAALIVPPARRLKVALVGRSTLELREMLKSLPLESLELMSVEKFNAITKTGETDVFDVFVFLDAVPDSLPPGRYLTFGPTPPIEDLKEFGTPAKGVVVSRTKDDHPILRYVNLDGLFVHKLHKIVPAGSSRVLVESVEGPMVFEILRGNVNLIHVAFDPLDSNWPIEKSWAIFVPNAMEYLGSMGDAVVRSGVVPGEALTTRLPAETEEVTMRLPDGEELTFKPIDPTSFTWGPARRVGLYEVTWSQSDGEDQRRIFAVNQFDSQESQIAAAEKIAFSVDEVLGTAGERGKRWTGLWPWLLGVAMALLLFEWWMWQRRAGAG